MQPNTKMSSGQATFDLKAARQICDQATFRLTGAEIDEDLKILIDQANMLPAALDEIDSWIADRDTWIARYQEQAKRIAELEAALHVEKSAHEETKYADSEAANQAFSRIAKQRAALKKLGQAKRERGKALVEERISGEFSDWIENQCPHWDIDEEPFCVELDGPCEYHEGKCPILAELHRIVREQLRREGKI